MNPGTLLAEIWIASPVRGFRPVRAARFLTANVPNPTSETARVIGAVAKGDLSQSMALEIDGRPLSGEFLRTAKTVNTMVEQLGSFAADHVTAFTRAMDDDLNTSVALSALHDLATAVNARLDELSTLPITEAEAGAALDAFARIDRVLGLLSTAEREAGAGVDDQLAAWVEGRLADRAAARAARDFATADQIRDELAARGIVVEDTPGGARWSRRG